MTKTEFRNIDMTVKFSNFQVLNPDFTRCRCSVMYTGKNRNYTDITNNALKKLIDRKGYANIPVVGHIRTNKDGKKVMGSHDRRLVISNEGIQEINECTAMGVVPEASNPSIEEIVDVHGIKKDYFCVDLILWTHYFPDLMETKYSDEIYFNQSMEIRINEWEEDGLYTIINDFSLQAICLLGKYDNTHGNIEDNQEPCFEDSVVKRFSIDENKFKQNFELMLEKLKQYETDNNTSVPNKETNNNPNMKGVIKVNLNNFVEIFSTLKVNEDTDVNKYRLLSVSDSKVYALDMEDYKPYGFDYAITTEEDSESIVVDFESKVEMSLSAVEKITDENFEEFSIKNEIDTIKEAYSQKNVAAKAEEVTKALSEAFQKDFDELKISYDALVKAHNIVQSKLASYEKKEEEAKIERHRNEIDKLVDSYADKLGKYSAYLIYKANIEQKYSATTEEVEQDLILMAGRYLTSKENANRKNFSYSPTETKVTKVENSSSRYGHLLDKYINN